MKLKSGLCEAEGYRCLGNLNNDSVDLRLIYCGYEDCEPGHRYGPNKRTAYLIHIILRGKGKLEIDGQTYLLEEGDAFLLRPEEEAWYEADYMHPWTYIWVGFSGMKAEECVTNSGFDNGNHVIHKVNHASLQNYVTEMLKAHNLSYSNSLRRCAYLQMFFADLIDQFTAYVPGIEKVENTPGAEYVRRLMTYIADNYKYRIRISELADGMGINRSYLSNNFKRITGYSPTEYLVQIRMEKAKSLLTKTNYSISQIASEVGYTDQLNFSRMFKQRFGESPKRYRDNVENLQLLDKKDEVPDAFL